jgi:hypothetical protein
MNKKLIAFLSIFSLFLSTLLIPANAAAKAGAKCNKAGITSVTTGKTFTCVKFGKKLVWNKGVAIVKPTQPAAPTGFNDLEANYSGVSYSAWKKSSEKISASSSPSIPLEILIGVNTKI